MDRIRRPCLDAEPRETGARPDAPASSRWLSIVLPSLFLGAIAASGTSISAGLPETAAAQDRVVLAEVLPALRGSDLGGLDLGPAPPPGSSRRVTRAEVAAALRRAGHDPAAFRIPTSVRVRRGAQRLSGAALTEIVQGALSRDLAPCEILSARVSGPVTLGAGPVAARAEADLPAREGEARIAGAVILSAGGRNVRLPVRARVRCPDPVMTPGDRVRIVAIVGAVRVSAMGEARQAGRVGDVIHVTNGATDATVEARVLDANTVQVVLR